MLRLMVMKLVVGAFLVLVLAGCGDDRMFTASSAGDASGPVPAQPVCEAAAEMWGGTVAGAFPMTVSQVRAYMGDLHGSAANAAAPKAVGAYAYPSGWDGLAEDASAAACYLDGHVPKGPPPLSDGTVQASFDRRLVIAAEGAESFMVSAGYKANMPAEPLSAAPTATANPGELLVPAPFAVRGVSDDGKTVSVVVAGVAGCSSPGEAMATDTQDGLLVATTIRVPATNQPCAAHLPMYPMTVELPRALRDGEQVLGECVPDQSTPEGRQCSATHGFAKSPPP